MTVLETVRIRRHSVGPGGVIGRRLLIAGFLMPATAGFIALLGQGVVEYGASTTVYVTIGALTLGMVGLLGAATSRLDLLDSRRDLADRATGRSTSAFERREVASTAELATANFALETSSDEASAFERREVASTAELATANQALKASNAELAAFCYSVSHDLRAPLRAIDGFSQVVLEENEAQLDESGREMLARVRAASQRMAVLIDELLRLSRITRQDLQLEPVDVTVLVEDIVGELEFEDPGRAVEVKVAPGLEMVADAKLLRLALKNLLSNAWKFTSKTEHAVVDIGVAGRDGYRGLYVRDNGAGFDMTYADKLFQPFERLHANESFPGIGVGLATVNRIVQRHGGKIWAEGEEGAGASFYVTLPAKDGASE
jgi:signal transduction histidine kinase